MAMIAACIYLKSPQGRFFVPFGYTDINHLFLQVRQNIEVFPFHAELLHSDS